MARKGLTLMETLAVIAVLCALIILLVPAVQRVRSEAARLRSANNLKNIILATQNYASVNNDQFPYYDFSGTLTGPCVFKSIYPYCEQNPAIFISPADPTREEAIQSGLTSYAANAQIFVGQPMASDAHAFNKQHLSRLTIQDGSSNTIAFAEHYSACDDTTFGLFVPCLSDRRRATFADKCDAYPITAGNPPTSQSSEPSEPSVTFQAAPALSRCNAFFAQTPHPSGMLVALADGSVRQLAPNIAPSVYWALVTPAAGDNPGADW